MHIYNLHSQCYALECLTLGYFRRHLLLNPPAKTHHLLQINNGKNFQSLSCSLFLCLLCLRVIPSLGGSRTRGGCSTSNIPWQDRKPSPWFMNHGWDTAWSSSGPSIDLQPNHQLLFLFLNLLSSWKEVYRDPAHLLCFCQNSLGVVSSRPWPWRIMGRWEDHLYPWRTYGWHGSKGQKCHKVDSLKLGLDLVLKRGLRSGWRSDTATF